MQQPTQKRQQQLRAPLTGTALSALSSEGRGLGWARALGTSCTESAAGAGAVPGPGRVPGNARLLLPHVTEQLRRKGRVYRGVFMACGAASH
jgi:hypothetical protein